MTQRKLFLSMLLLLLWAAGARATTLARMSLEELSAAADVIAEVRCLGSESRWEGGEIWTFTRFEAGEILKGSTPRILTVRLIGGRVGHLISTVEGVPSFRDGEEAILFLERTRAGDFAVLGWVQGTFRILRNAQTDKQSVTQDSSGMAVFDPATQRFGAQGIRRMPIDDFKMRVTSAVEQARVGRRP